MGSNQMGEIQYEDDPTFPAKRKLHSPEGDKKEEGAEAGDCVPTKKALKIQSFGTKDSQTPQPAPGPYKGKGLAELEGEEDEEEEEEDDGDYREEEDEVERGPVDRKGKGVLVVEDCDSDEDDDDDSSEDDDESELEGEDGDSDADEEDPLAEVDLDNILPSRTRRGSSQGGVSIGRNGRGDDGDSDA